MSLLGPRELALLSEALHRQAAGETLPEVPDWAPGGLFNAARISRGPIAAQTAPRENTLQIPATERQAILAASTPRTDVVRPAGSVVVQKGDGFESIARRNLGPNASPADVRRRAAQIADFNGVGDLRSLQPNQFLKLPPSDWAVSAKTQQAFVEEAKRHQTREQQTQAWKQINERGMPAYLAANGVQVVRRQQWGSEWPVSPKRTLEPSGGRFDSIVLHHTSTRDTPDSVAKLHTDEGTISEIARRVFTLGRAKPYEFADVGYHFMIGPDGAIYEGRDLRYKGAHVGGNNTGRIGVAFLGNYADRQLTPAQTTAANALIKQLRFVYGIESVSNHGEFDRHKTRELQGASTQLRQIEQRTDSPFSRPTLKRPPGASAK